KGNPWNMNPNARMEWAQGLDFPVKVVGEDVQDLTEVDWLFWVGCAGAYEDRAKKVTRAVAELLDMAGVSFAVLGNGETCTGDSARRAGNEFVFQALAQQNIETFNEHKVKKVVSTCAHCFNTLKNEYKEFGIELEVVHHTQLLNRLVREKKLTPVAAPGPTRKITYHDPCFLGRHNQVYSPPRELLEVIPGSELTEMPRNSERSFCCGAGGARMWMEETIGERINVNRTVEAVATGADQIAVGCPFCRTMLEDGLTSEQDAGRAGEQVEVLDVAQLLLASVKGEGKKEKSSEPKAKAAAPAAAAAAPAEAPAEAAKPAASGGSLFDAAPAAPAEPAAAPAKPAASGGSLFDTPAPEAAKPAASSGSLFDTPAPEPAKPAEAKAEAPAEAPAAAPAKPAESTGSLFDIAAPAEAPKAEAPNAEAPKTEAPKTEAPKAEAPKAEAPKADLGGGGSLFDIVAEAKAEAPKAEEKAAEPEAAAPAVEPVETPEPEAETEAEPETEPEAETEAVPAEKAEEKPAPPASSGEAHTPKTGTNIPEGGSLFDI
ncbi:MAG: (Fe-S)-binding protein, partial [Marmoricola sp.]